MNKKNTAVLDKVIAILAIIVFLLIVGTSLVACADHDPIAGGPGPSPSPSPTAQELARAIVANNTYLGACQDQGNGLRFDLVFGASDDVNSRITLFEDGTCATSLLEVTRNITYAVSSPNSEGNYPVDLSYNQFLITVYNQDLVDSFNGGGGLCGYTDPISLGVAFDITAGAADCLSDLAPSKEYQLLSIAPTVVYGGLKDDDHDGLSEATRPVSVDLTMPYTK